MLAAASRPSARLPGCCCCSLSGARSQKRGAPRPGGSHLPSRGLVGGSPRGPGWEPAGEPAHCPAGAGAPPRVADHGQAWMAEMGSCAFFSTAYCSLSLASAQVAWVFGASLCLHDFRIYLVCIPCPPGRCGNAEELVTSTPSHRATSMLNPTSIPHE